MHYPPLVRVVHRRGDVVGNLDRLLNRELAVALQPVSQRFPLDIGHHAVQEAVRLPCLVKGEDLWMLQLGGELDLLEEPICAQRRGELRAEHLDRHLSVESQILGEVIPSDQPAEQAAKSCSARR